MLDWLPFRVDHLPEKVLFVFHLFYETRNLLFSERILEAGNLSQEVLDLLLLILALVHEALV